MLPNVRIELERSRNRWLRSTLLSSVGLIFLLLILAIIGWGYFAVVALVLGSLAIAALHAEKAFGIKCPYCGQPTQIGVPWYNYLAVIKWGKVGARCERCGTDFEKPYQADVAKQISETSKVRTRLDAFRGET